MRALAQVDIALRPTDAEAVDESARRIQADGVLGIPDGMTVGGLVIRKGEG